MDVAKLLASGHHSQNRVAGTIHQARTHRTHRRGCGPRDHGCATRMGVLFQAAWLLGCVARRTGRSKPVQGRNASRASLEANIWVALWPVPGSSTRRQLKDQDEACASNLAVLKALSPRS
jgi:hypothetical protein